LDERYAASSQVGFASHLTRWVQALQQLARFLSMVPSKTSCSSIAQQGWSIVLLAHARVVALPSGLVSVEREGSATAKSGGVQRYN